LSPLFSFGYHVAVTLYDTDSEYAPVAQMPTFFSSRAKSQHQRDVTAPVGAAQASETLQLRQFPV
jgi:hypothetical protein